MKKKEFHKVVIELLRSINKRLAEIEKAPVTMPNYSAWPSTDDYPLICSVCGKEMSNTADYVCTRTDCPSGQNYSPNISSGYDSSTPTSIENTPSIWTKDE